jgi:hypothetical protein
MGFDDAITKLKSSPVYAMSLGSKELFHSNFWAWLMEQDSCKEEFIKFFFEDLQVDKIYDIAREQGHRDLTIWTCDIDPNIKDRNGNIKKTNCKA